MSIVVNLTGTDGSGLLLNTKYIQTLEIADNATHVLGRGFELEVFDSIDEIVMGAVIDRKDTMEKLNDFRRKNAEPSSSILVLDFVAGYSETRENGAFLESFNNIAYARLASQNAGEKAWEVFHYADDEGGLLSLSSVFVYSMKRQNMYAVSEMIHDHAFHKFKSHLPALADAVTILGQDDYSTDISVAGCSLQFPR